jgi:hypothetical protein
MFERYEFASFRVRCRGAQQYLIGAAELTVFLLLLMCHMSRYGW